VKPRTRSSTAPRGSRRAAVLTAALAALLLPTAALGPGAAAGEPDRAPARTLAPPAPTGLRVDGMTGTSVSFTWRPSSGATEYELARDGVVISKHAIPSGMAFSLQPSTTYRFKVRALDSSGGASPYSAEVTATTTSDPGGGGGATKWAGARSSNYGIRPFPAPCGWGKALKTASGYFPGSTPAAVWIVGTISGGGVNLEFPRPNDGRNYGSRIRFASSDKHERYLDYFDAQGIKVWLQVESGFADMPTLIDLVLNRYKSHPSVLGFGVDVEWYNPRGADLNDRVTDEIAKRWDEKVQSHGTQYSLFLKHFDQSSMPATYRGKIVFVDDSQELGSTAAFLAEFKAWADRYYPNPVLYQIGYESDRPWWSREAAPVPKTLGEKLRTVTRQDHGIAWVDFTLRRVLPTTC
jgi:hypothetical protein